MKWLEKEGYKVSAFRLYERKWRAGARNQLALKSGRMKVYKK